MARLFSRPSLLLLAFIISAAYAAATAVPRQPVLSLVTVFEPPSNANWTDPRVLYARTVQLSNGDILATWENYSPESPPNKLVYFPIFKSTDGGKSWSEFSRVTDQVKGWGLRYQPDLYVLPGPIGGYKKGDILLSGSAIPTDLSQTQIELYASRDQGKTWKFVSHIAAGGEARPNNGLTPVWEPFLKLYKGKLICYYSDQRDPKHGQKLVHQTTQNLRQWSEIRDDVAEQTYTDRPGMPTVADLPNGKFIYTYEYGTDNHPGFSGYAFPVYYRISKDPLNFIGAPKQQLVSTDGTTPTGSPYVVWSPIGGKNGTIVVSSGSNSEIFVNQELGAPKAWRKIPTPEGISYTRHLRVLKDPSKLLIMGGGILPPSETNKVTVSVIDLALAIKS